MKAFQRSVLQWSLLLLAAGLLSMSCAEKPASQNQTVVRVMAFPWIFGKYPLREAKERFEKRHPGVTVELLKAPGEGSHRLLVSLMSGRSDADLILGPNEGDVAVFAARDLLLPWDDYIEKNPQIGPTNFLTVFYEMCRFGSRQYGLPVSGELVTFSINKKMAAEAGLLNPDGTIRFARTWQEVFDYARKMTVDRDRDGKPERVGLTINWQYGESLWFGTIMSGEGRIRDGDSLLVDVPAVRDLFSLCREAAREGILSLATLTDSNADRNDMKAGLTAMILTYHSRYLEVQEVLGKNSTTIMPLPGQHVGQSCANAFFTIVPSNSRAVALARQFAEEELLAPYFSEYAFQKYGKLPCIRSVMEAQGEAPEYRWLLEWSEKSTARPFVRDQIQLTDAIRRNQQRFLSEEISLEEMIQGIDRELTRLNTKDSRMTFE